MQVKINLNNPPTADKINVDLQWRVQVTSPKGGLFAKLFRKHNRVSRDVRITVSDIIVPQDIVCDKNNLFSILYGDKLYSQSDFPVEAHINDMAQPFQLLFHQAEIKDCIKPQDENPRSYSIHFTVNLTDLKGKVIDSVKEKIDIANPISKKRFFVRKAKALPVPSQRTPSTKSTPLPANANCFAGYSSMVGVRVRVTLSVSSFKYQVLAPLGISPSERLNTRQL